VYFFYSLLLTLGFIALLPKFAIDALRTRKYVTGLSQRLGKLPVIIARDRPLIWIHCVSVGETEAARPLIRALLERFPSHQLVISTTTVTGQKITRAAFEREAAAVIYFPIDWAWTVRRVLRTLQPAAVLIMETELWPHLLRECRARAIPVALVNGRISATSFRRYKLISVFIRRVLNDLSIALMQSEEDAARIRALGLAEERILMSGNLKFDSAEIAADRAVVADLAGRFGLNEKPQLIVAGSTHGPEEMVMVEAFRRLRTVHRDSTTRLVIAPRHPERFAEVASLLQKSGLTWARRSNPPAIEDVNCDVILLDTVGELRAVYSLAVVAFVGGSIAAHGGHNVLEPASLGVAVVTGPHTQNFAAITRAFLDEKAIVQLPDTEISEAPTGLASGINDLLTDEARRHGIAQRALAVCDRNRGATARTIEIIEGMLALPAADEAPLPFNALHVTTAK
jgi:3-deoxy-D-manno-octulosonic-acid transferase